MSYDRFRVSVECLENGYKVEIPDMEEIAKRQAAAKKKNPNDPCCYYGGATKSYVAKTVPDVLKLVKGSLEKIPEATFQSAFAEAAKLDKSK